MKNVFKFIILYVLLFSIPIVTCYAGYSPGSIKEDNTRPEESEIFYTNDSTAFINQVKYEMYVKDNWGSLDDDSKNKLAEMFGVDASSVTEFGSSTSGNFSKNISMLGKTEMICPILSPAVLNDEYTGQWKYSTNMYAVRTENFKPWVDVYPYACMMSDREYKMFYKLCQLYKWDYLVLLAKWNYQSAHQFCLEECEASLNQGLAGQIVTEDGGVSYLDKLFTSEELSKTGSKSRINNIWSTKKTGHSPGPAYKTSFVRVDDIIKEANAIGFSQSAERWKWLGTVTDDKNLELMKMNLIFLKEARLVLSSITKGKTRDYSKKDWTKLREILQKEEWSDEDYDYCFGDLVEDDVFYKEYDDAPRWKQQAYLILKHWALGSSDSGTAHIMIDDISKYIKNSDFNIDHAKRFVFQALAGEIVVSGIANGKKETKDSIVSYYQNPRHYAGHSVAYSRWVTGVSLEKLDKIFESNSVPDYYDIFDSDFEAEINKGTLMKGVLFALSGFISGDLDVNSMSEHGACHCGITRQTIYLGDGSNGCAEKVIHEAGTHYNQGGSYVRYGSSLNYWFGTGTWKAA